MTKFIDIAYWLELTGKQMRCVPWIEKYITIMISLNYNRMFGNLNAGEPQGSIVWPKLFVGNTRSCRSAGDFDHIYSWLNPFLIFRFISLHIADKNWRLEFKKIYLEHNGFLKNVQKQKCFLIISTNFFQVPFVLCYWK